VYVMLQDLFMVDAKRSSTFRSAVALISLLVCCVNIPKHSHIRPLGSSVGIPTISSPQERPPSSHGHSSTTSTYPRSSNPRQCIFGACACTAVLASACCDLIATRAATNPSTLSERSRPRLTPLWFLVMRGIEVGRLARRERAQSDVDLRWTVDGMREVVDESIGRSLDELEAGMIVVIVVVVEWKAEVDMALSLLGRCAFIAGTSRNLLATMTASSSSASMETFELSEPALL
jgi:hypothetical protein